MYTSFGCSNIAHLGKSNMHSYGETIGVKHTFFMFHVPGLLWTTYRFVNMHCTQPIQVNR